MQMLKALVLVGVGCCIVAALYLRLHSVRYRNPGTRLIASLLGSEELSPRGQKYLQFHNYFLTAAFVLGLVAIALLGQG